jgi:antitoxin VapB
MDPRFRGDDDNEAWRARPRTFQIHHVKERKARDYKARTNNEQGVSISRAGGFMTRTRVLRNECSQSIRLPDEAAFPNAVKEVVILRDGPRRVIVPADSAWDDFFAEPGIDLPDRAQPPFTGRGMDSARRTRDE